MSDRPQTLSDRVSSLKSGSVVRGPLFPEPIQVLLATPMGLSVKVVGKGLESGKLYEPVLDESQIALLSVSPVTPPYDGHAENFRLGIEALRLGLAYEYDPYFSLSIARVDPLPHQLEAVYDNFIKLPRVRFLLADDPGAGKTIMAGLLVKEMKVRGLVKRTLIVTPANLTFQWQRELKDKFRESFEVVRGDVLRANYGSNPWQEKDQVITSISWISRVPDARDSLLRSRWDLIIVDEAHKMSASSPDHKTLAYELGESLSGMTDHFLLMTATPHKGDPENFCLFLRLLDADVYADVKSLEDAMRRNSAPFYLRRTKEALVTFPDPETGTSSQAIHEAGRSDRTVQDQLRGMGLLPGAHPVRGGPVNQGGGRGRHHGPGGGLHDGDAAAPLRFQHLRCPPQPGADAGQAPAHPGGPRGLPPGADRQEAARTTSTTCPRTSRRRSWPTWKRPLPLSNPADLHREIAELTGLIDQARLLEEREVETKLAKLQDVISQQSVFKDSADEAPGVHRAQGHPRPTLSKSSPMGPERDADFRRHEDRRSRHARHPAARRARSSRTETARRFWLPPKRQAKASTSSSAGS